MKQPTVPCKSVRPGILELVERQTPYRETGKC